MVDAISTWVVVVAVATAIVVDTIAVKILAAASQNVRFALQVRRDPKALPDPKEQLAPKELLAWMAPTEWMASSTLLTFTPSLPGDNSATIAAGADVDFPQNGPSSGSGLIYGLTSNSFNLTAIGAYEVQFQVSVDEPGQLLLTLNGTDLAYTVVGRATGTSQIVGMAIIRTTTTNSVLTVRNPAGNSTALTITPTAGGARSVSAHLIVKQLQ